LQTTLDFLPSDKGGEEDPVGVLELVSLEWWPKLLHYHPTTTPRVWKSSEGAGAPAPSDDFHSGLATYIMHLLYLAFIYPNFLWMYYFTYLVPLTTYYLHFELINPEYAEWLVNSFTQNKLPRLRGKA
jgi:hypothetical protein